MRLGLFAVIVGLLIGPFGADAKTRIKDIAVVQGVRTNQLIGYGLVVGLNGTGDSLRNAPFTTQSVQSMLDRMGVNVRSGGARTRNIAAVVVTAELPPYIGKGSRLDVTVSSIGDATSLAGGSLVLTPLNGADQAVYAVAQGPIAVAGFQGSGRSETLTQGVPTAGRIANGGIVEREVPGQLEDRSALTFELRNPDFTTAVRIADAINVYSKTRYGVHIAREMDLRAISVVRPRGVTAARLVAEIGELQADPDSAARVVIDERSGTVVIGSEVQVSTVAVAYGNLTVRVTDAPRVSQPQPFSRGETVTISDTAVSAREDGGPVAIVRGARLEQLVTGLNRMGLKPSGIIAVLQAIKTAGALHAELVVQ
jgi:flagellar P-ring protein precursor FlgI